MNKPTRFPEEFKIEAVKQVTEHGHRVAEVAAQFVALVSPLWQDAPNELETH